MDARHTAEERRFFTVGLSRRGRLLTVAHAAKRMRYGSFPQGRRVGLSDEIMKDQFEDDELPGEIDFSTGLRGKYAQRFQRDVLYVPLAADVSASFRNAEEVNAALRLLIKAADAAVLHRERKAS